MQTIDWIRIAGAGLLAGMLACGCATYVPEPIDWEREAEMAKPREVTFRTLDEIGRTAVFGNEELRIMRVKLAASERVAELGALLEDPEIDFDATHFLRPGEHPFTRGASLAFTLPLTGANFKERDALRFYTEADAWALKAREKDIATDARKCAIRLLDARKRNPGTVDEVEAHAALVAVLGYVGGTRIILNLKPCACNPCKCSPCKCDVCPCKCCALPEMTAKDLTRHPRVLAVLAKHNGCESRLDAEVRRQYPELKAGPAYEREEGIDRLGIVAGITLPLWNRNRKGIAEARGERHVARCEVINEWRAVVREYHAAVEVAKVAEGLDLVLAREELRRFALD